MKWIVLLGFTLTSCLASGTAIADDNLLDQVRADGTVSKELAQRTGWKSLRGVRWQIVVPDPAGGIRTVSPNQTFRTGQLFRVEIEAHVCDVWVYMLTFDPQNKMIVLFPKDSQEHRSVRKSQKVCVPASPDWLRFEGEPGTDLLRIVFSPKPLDWHNRKVFADREISDADRAKSQGTMKSVFDAQMHPSVEEHTLANMVKRLESDDTLRSQQKNVVLRPPPSGPSGTDRPGGTADEILVANSQAPTVVNLVLKHR